MHLNRADVYVNCIICVTCTGRHFEPMDNIKPEFGVSALFLVKYCLSQ